jgi:farnesyl-diphosphate farnesyltransferase
MYLSFAVLPRTLRAPLGLAYMLCRAADTIADGTLLPVVEKRQHLSRYRNLFVNFPFHMASAGEFAHEIAGVRFTEIAQDQALLENLRACFQDFALQSPTDQALIAGVVRAVIDGMEIDLNVFEDDATPRALSTIADFEKYIRLIGGEPGRFWSEMSAAHQCVPSSVFRQSWVQDGLTFGAGLQMVNILRDLPVDLKRGRCYLPEELLTKHGLTLEQIVPPPVTDDAEEPKKPPLPFLVPHLVEDKFRALYVDLVESARKKLLAGLDYLAKIPAWSWGLRAAVVWPMLIGLKTLKRLQETPTILNSTLRVKVTRREIYWMLATSAALIPSQRWIEREARSIN